METKTIPDVVEQKKDIESNKNLFALHQRDYIQGVNNLNGMDFKDPSYSFSVYKVRSEEVNLLIEGDVAADIANNAEEIIEELSLVKGDSTKLLRKIGSGELSDTVSRVAAERAVQDSVTSEGSKPLFMRDALDLIRERAERIKNEGLIVGATSSSQENNHNSIEFTAEPVSGYKIIKQGDYIKNNSTDFDLKERDLSSVSTGTDQAGSMSIVDEKIKEKELSQVLDYGNDEGFLRPIVNGGFNFPKEEVANVSNRENKIENKRRLTEEEYELQIKKWNEIIKGTQQAVENVENIVQEKRSSVFWRLQNLGIKNVTTGIRLKLRSVFSDFANKAKTMFGFSQESSSEKLKIETFLSQEYITQEGENLSTVIKEQIFNIPEISELTDEQKNKAIQNLFEYAKKNPNMSMFNQINTFSSQDVIQPGEKLDLQMIKQLLTFPIDSLNNKSIIEYTKELS